MLGHRAVGGEIDGGARGRDDGAVDRGEQFRARLRGVSQQPEARHALHLLALRAPHLAHEVELALAARVAAAAVELHQHPFALERGKRRERHGPRRQQRAVIARHARREIEPPDEPARAYGQQEKQREQRELQARVLRGAARRWAWHAGYSRRGTGPAKARRANTTAAHSFRAWRRPHPRAASRVRVRHPGWNAARARRLRARGPTTRKTARASRSATRFLRLPPCPAQRPAENAPSAGPTAKSRPPGCERQAAARASRRRASSRG